MKILIVEDNIVTCKMLKNFLVKNRFTCEYVTTYTAAIEIVNISEFDVILLDINLPDNSGLELITYIRNSSLNPKVGIIMVSALKKTLEALNLGADDYINKPIDTDILLARIRGLIRRINNNPNTVIRIGSLALDTVENRITVNDTEVQLLAKEFQILSYLMYMHPKIVTTEELIEHIYDDSIDPFSSVLRVHLSRLRSKISQANNGEELVFNRKNMGYHL